MTVTTSDDTLLGFAALLREARAACRDERALVHRVRGLALTFAAESRQWLRSSMCEPDEEQGFGLHLLHEEPDHSLATFVVTWLPGRGTPPHDHGTWAVIVGLDGDERNILWRRLDDGRRPGFATLVPAGERNVGAGEVIAMPEGVIHSVRNDTARMTVSLHVYGRHINYTARSRFDPDAGTESPYTVRIHA